MKITEVKGEHSSDSSITFKGVIELSRVSVESPVLDISRGFGLLSRSGKLCELLAELGYVLFRRLNPQLGGLGLFNLEKLLW